jgi:hypothetical protein
MMMMMMMMMSEGETNGIGNQQMETLTVASDAWFLDASDATDTRSR